MLIQQAGTGWLLGTPLGDVMITASAEGASGEPCLYSPSETGPTAFESRTGTLRMDSLCTRYVPYEMPAEERLVAECRGVRWRFLAVEAATARIVITAELRSESELSIEDGQYLAAVMASSTEGILYIGGPDEEACSERRNQESLDAVAHLGGDGRVFEPEDFCVEASTAYPRSAPFRGLQWVLPPLEPARWTSIDLAVAWSSARGEGFDAALWAAVDLLPGTLTTAASPLRAVTRVDLATGYDS